jgi:UDP-glucose 4-epimerase
MKLLITGGAGYIGSITTEQLIAQGHEVVVFDNLYQGHRAAVHPKAVFVKGDLAIKSEISAAIATHKPEAVMHFAAYSLVGESMQKPFKYLQENTNNGLNLMEALCEHGIKKFILSSTANLFDQPENMPITEKEKIIPGSPYGESKFIMERALHWLDKTHGMKYACLRYFNAAGASEERGEDHNPELHLIPLVLQVALGQREHISIFGNDYDTPDGTCVRDYIHVIDLAQAHILALGALGQGSCTYNLGNGQGFSVKQVIETAREITGHSIPVQYAPRRAGDPAILVGASDKIRKDLGWSPRYPELRDIISTAWAWHQKYPQGYKSLQVNA